MGNIHINYADQPSLIEYLPRNSSSHHHDEHYKHYTEITDLFQAKLKHSWHLFFGSSVGSKLYQDYLRRGDWVSKASSHYNVGSILSSLKGPNVQISKGSTDSYDEKSSISVSKQQLIDIAFADSDALQILHSIVFPIFLQSEEYKGWITHCLEDQESTDNLYKGEKMNLEMLPDQTMRMKDTLTSGMSVIDPLEIKKLFLHEYWVYQLIAYVEDFPLPISLATARFDRKGFPIIYVNKSFERMTLYERKEIIGRNCKFLQSHETESFKISKISEALRFAQATKVIISNIRRTGESFLNLLAMKPIFDMNGVYSYVICVHYEVTNFTNIPYNVSQVDDFLATIPNVLITRY